MVTGEFGVFDGVDMLAEFADDESAEEYRRDALELNIPEGFRLSAYDDLQVAEVRGGFAEYGSLHRTLRGLRASRRQDKTVTSCLQLLRAAQHNRAEARRGA